MLSGDGNEQYTDDQTIFTPQERKKLALGHVHISGIWVKPVKNEAGVVTGTHFLFFNMFEAGGNVPTFVQNKLGPKSALDQIKGTIKWATEYKAKNQQSAQ